MYCEKSQHDCFPEIFEYGAPNNFIECSLILRSIIFGWPKCPFSFFHKIKDTIFILNNNFIDLDILSMSAISHLVLLINVSIWLLSTSLVYPTVEPPPERNLQHETSQQLFICSVSHFTFSIQCTKLFLCFSCVFTFLEKIRHGRPRMLWGIFHLQY